MMGVATGSVSLDDVRDKFSGRVRELVEVLSAFYDRYRLPVFRKLARRPAFVWGSLFRCEFYGREYSVRFAPEVAGGAVSFTKLTWVGSVWAGAASYGVPPGKFKSRGPTYPSVTSGFREP